MPMAIETTEDREYVYMDWSLGIVMWDSQKEYGQVEKSGQDIFGDIKLVLQTLDGSGALSWMASNIGFAE